MAAITGVMMEKQIFVVLESETDLKVSKLKAPMTLGSAISNSIVISGRGVRALQGQIVFDDQQFAYRDFNDRSCVRLCVGDGIFHMGSWRGYLLDEQRLWQLHSATFQRALAQCLQAAPEAKWEKILEQLEHELSFGFALPVKVVTELKDRYGEYQLRGPLEKLLDDKEITDILVESHDSIFVEKLGSLSKSAVCFSSEAAYRLYVENLLSRLHKTLDEINPYVDFILPGGARGHVIAPPLTDGRVYFSIRKPRDILWSLRDLKDRQMLSAAQYQWLEKALEERWNLLISGATGSGKTTLLKSLLMKCRFEERIVVIEDTPELRVPRENTAFLNTRLENRGTAPPVSLRDLVKQTLRMRPDRLCIGEVRGAEALDLLHAMNTGHRGCLGTLHANSARDALLRLQGLVQLSEASLSEHPTRDLISRNIHAVIHCGRGVHGERRVAEVAIVRGVDREHILLEHQAA